MRERVSFAFAHEGRDGAAHQAAEGMAPVRAAAQRKSAHHAVCAGDVTPEPLG